MALNPLNQVQIDSLRIQDGNPSGLCLSKVLSTEKTLHLIVGLGGSGCDMLRETKGLINRICRDDSDKRKAPKRVVYLGIDTDNSATGPLKSAWTSSDGTKVKLNTAGSATETLPLANGSMMDIMDPTKYAVNKGNYPLIFEWLDLDARNNMIHGGNGACGVRQAGRVCLFLAMNSVLNKIREVLSNASSGETIANVNVFVLSGVAGGTGSGIFLDMAYILRKQAAAALNLPDKSVRVFGYLVMPDVNEQKGDDLTKDYVPTNGYAALQELDYLMNLPKQGGRYRQVYVPGLFEVDTDAPPFDYVHLLSHRDANGLKTEDYYKRVMAAAAQNILAFVARETHDPKKATHAGSAASSMELVYSNVPKIVNSAGPDKVKYPERSYVYQTLGTSEYALPLDDIYKYVTSLVFDGMNSLFKNEPTDEDLMELAQQLCLTPNSWYAAVTDGIPDPFRATGNLKDVFAADRQDDHVAAYNNALESARDVIQRNAELLERTFAERLQKQLAVCFTDLARGPVWVNHLLVNYLIPYLERERNKLAVRITTCRQGVQEEKDTRDELIKKKKKNDADAFMGSWNQQFQWQLQAIALRYLYEDMDNDPGACSLALGHISVQNTKWFNVITEVLKEIRNVANTNTTAVVNAGFQGKNSFTWSVVTLPQVSRIVKDMFDSHFEVTTLVKAFVVDLLTKSDDWAANGVDVTGFLEEYLEKNLSDITNTSMEYYLEELLVKSGVFGSLKDALAGPGGLFETLQTQAKHLLLTDCVPAPCYVLSVPASCKQICEAADEYAAAAHGGATVSVQYSTVRTRICVQSMACVIPLYSYTELRRYEKQYFNSMLASLAGIHLRAVWTPPGETPAVDVEDWFKLPSPVPSRMRGMGIGDCPDAVKNVETERRKLFNDLLETPALVMRPNPKEAGDVDFVFIESKPWARCGVREILGDQDQKLKHQGVWNAAKIKAALETLRHMRANGLPRAEDIMDVDGHFMPKEVFVARECTKQADTTLVQAAKNAAQIDPAEGERLMDAARRKIAEEFFVGSMPLSIWGAREREKYAMLDKEIVRLEGILSEIGDFNTDCMLMVKLFATDSVKEDTTGQNKSCYAVLTEDGWDTDNVDLTFENPVVKEYELFRKLQAMKLHDNPYVRDSYKVIMQQVDERYNLVAGGKAGIEDVLKLLEALQDFKEVMQIRVKKCKDSLGKNGVNTASVYTEDALRYYEQLLAWAGTLDENIRETYRKELAVVSNQAQQNPWGAPPQNPWGAPAQNPWGAPAQNPWGAPAQNPWGAPAQNPWGAPAQNPWGAPAQNPWGAPAQNPWGAPAQNPWGAPPQNPWGAPAQGDPNASQGNPYGMPPQGDPNAGNPYGMPPQGDPSAGNPYGMPPQGNPYGMQQGAAVQAMSPQEYMNQLGALCQQVMQAGQNPAMLPMLQGKLAELKAQLPGMPMEVQQMAQQQIAYVESYLPRG